MKRFSVAVLVVCPLISGCIEIPGAGASLGGDTAGSRGEVRLIIINNTAEQSVFTVGTYDPLDQTSEPFVVQFGLTDSEGPLLGDSTSDITEIQCGRILSFGSPRMLELIEENLPDADLVENALVEGIKFYHRDEDDEDADPVLMGEAGPFEAELGIDFSCGSIIVIHLELNDVGTESYRIDFEVIPAESTR